MLRIPVRLAACSGLAALGWAGTILGDGSMQWLTLMLALWGASAAVSAYPALRRIRLPGLSRRRAVTVSDIGGDRFTEFWLRVEVHVRHIRVFREAYAGYLRKTGSGLTYEYDTHARRAVHLALTAAPLAAVPVIFGEPAAALLAAAPAVAVYPLVQLWGRVRQHAVQVEEEMSFFLCYLTTMQGVGYTLYTAFERMRDAPDVFVALTRDAASLTKDVALGTPHMDALREYAASHPVPAFRDFLHGYISKHETVGPVPSYTEAKSEQFFESYRRAWENYKNSAVMMAAMAVMAAVMIPVMMVMMVFVATPATVNILLGLGPALGPVFAVALLFMVGSSQPSTGVKMRPWLPALGVGAAAAILVYVAMAPPGGDFWDGQPGVAVSAGFAAGGLANHVMVRRQLGGASDVDRGLPEFLGDVTEQTMAGSAISAILRQQARGGIYAGLFGRLLRGIVSRLETGATMEEACAEARRHSRYLSFVLFIMMRLQEVGSSSPSVLQQMTRFMAGIVSTKEDVAKSLRMGAVMIYAAPAMLLGISGAMFAVLADGSAASSTLSGMMPPGTIEGFRPPNPDSGYGERLGVMAALLTCPMGLVAAKITKFTAVYTLPVVVVGAVNAASIIAMPILMEALPI